MPRPLNPHQPPRAGETGINIYGYVPSQSLAIAALVLFSLVVLGSLTWAIRYGKRTRAYHLLIAFAGAMEIVGFAFRLRSHSNPYLLIPFVLQYFMIVVAPVFFSAAIYLSLSIIITANPATAQALPPKLTPHRILATFVTFDVVTTILQVVGAALIGVGYSRLADGEKPPLTPEQANRILTAGLAVQTAAFGVFVGIFAAFCWRGWRKLRWGMTDVWMLCAIAAASLLLWTRIVFRLAETAAGADSSILQDEGLFLIEFEPSVIAMLLLTAVPLEWRLRKQRSSSGEVDGVGGEKRRVAGEEEAEEV